ncbi:hypothetical protein [Pseudoclavibacter sp. VKM Ac-2867]|uniref:hypothetical protein n=1 Tax=Pseudoclavibacter sp. VKM Ac-2867 TaxID=2783829 RepID=UPI00188AE184|nr:hypothetical protein [Pseudoclavibacter sp. VKM Ac-2867]MBF4459380.1 hypothetical protein [Pseudoclavibacter sp. VKM Ac-2867]
MPELLAALDWPSFWVGVAAAVTAPAVLFGIFYVVVFVFVFASSRNIGLGGCMVCDRAPTCEVGEKTELQVLFPKLWHDQVLARMPAHRKAWRAHRWHPDNIAARAR